MLKLGKLSVLRLAEATGLSRLLSASAWRRNRLLILGYHGISLYDEHEWSGLYISADTLRRRMDALVKARCNVLPLGEAIQRMQDGSLPDRAVTITFDDGFHDFYRVAFPLIESYGFPVTLYLTTYYVGFNRPVFDPMCSYLLWKGRDKNQLKWPAVFSHPVTLDAAGREFAVDAIKRFAISAKFSAQEKDDLLAELAAHLGLDYQQLCADRVLNLINPEEAKDLISRGADLQYHTHRHRVCRTRDCMVAELQDNRNHLRSYGSTDPLHFCYPYGFDFEEYPNHLRDYGILSATTSRPGLSSPQSHPLLLPRLVDTKSVSDLEFRAWLAGTADLLPRRREEISGVHLEVAPAIEPIQALSISQIDSSTHSFRP